MPARCASGMAPDHCSRADATASFPKRSQTTSPKRPNFGRSPTAPQTTRRGTVVVSHHAHPPVGHVCRCGSARTAGIERNP